MILTNSPSLSLDETLGFLSKGLDHGKTEWLPAALAVVVRTADEVLTFISNRHVTYPTVKLDFLK